MCIILDCHSSYTALPNLACCFVVGIIYTNDVVRSVSLDSLLLVLPSVTWRNCVSGVGVVEVCVARSWGLRLRGVWENLFKACTLMSQRLRIRGIRVKSNVYERDEHGWESKTMYYLKSKNMFYIENTRFTNFTMLDHKYETFLYQTPALNPWLQFQETTIPRWVTLFFLII